MSSRGVVWASLWLPVAAYVAFIFWISSAYRPVPGIEIFPQMDKVAHAAEYAPLGGLLIRAILRSFPAFPGARAMTVALLAAFLVGGLDECYQSFVPMKFASPWDLLADGIGAWGGTWTYVWRVARTP